MKLITLQVDTETAKRILEEHEGKLSEKRIERNEISEEIEQLENTVKSLREQIQGTNGEIVRAPAGENKAKIIAHLKAIPSNRGAKMSEIVKATGVGTSSVNFILTSKKNKNVFIKEGKLWKLV